jgi:hypothetical protein
MRMTQLISEPLIPVELEDTTKLEREERAEEIFRRVAGTTLFRDPIKSERAIQARIPRQARTEPWTEGMIRSFWHVLAAGPRYRLDEKAWAWAEIAPPEFFAASFNMGNRRRSGLVLADGEWAITSTTDDAKNPDGMAHIFTNLDWDVLKGTVMPLEERIRVLRCMVLESYRMIGPRAIFQPGQLVKLLQIGIHDRIDDKAYFGTQMANLVLACENTNKRAVTFAGIPHMEG